MRLGAWAAIGLVGCAGCAGTGNGGARIAVVEVPSPSPSGSGMPNLATAPDGSVYLSWIERPAEGAPAVRFSRGDGEGWSAPRTIAEDPALFVNWADFPSMLATEDGGLAAHWLRKSGEGPYAYDVKVAWSSDGGASWGEPTSPHRDGVQTEHGFVSLVALGPGTFGAAWLDGRHLEAASGGHGGHGEMALMYSVWERGAFRPEVVLDSRVCDCCQTTATATPRGVLVAYRDRSEDEIRDIAFVRGKDGAWSRPTELHADGWRIDGCPVNGPAVARAGQRLALAWFSDAGERRVHVAFSTDAGGSFGPPVRVDEGAPLGRVDVAWLDEAHAVVCWLEHAPGASAQLRARAVRPGSPPGPPVLVATTSGARASGFPRLARMGDGVLVAWTDPSEPPRVRLARLEPAEPSR